MSDIRVRVNQSNLSTVRVGQGNAVNVVSSSSGSQGTQGLQGTQGRQGTQGLQGIAGPVSGSANQIVYKNASNVATGNTNFLFLNDSTFIVGAATSTGTANQKLQITGDAYVSGNIGIGTTNATSKLTVTGNVLVSGITTVGLGSTSTPPSNSQMSFELITDTELTIKVRGSDGVLRSGNITLS